MLYPIFFFQRYLDIAITGERQGSGNEKVSDNARKTALSESALVRHPNSHDRLRDPLGWFVVLNRPMF